jgi:DNA replication and repair protein RecF
MHLKELSLVNFKNYAEASLAFDGGVNFFTGDNGEGKTNLLDAIHYLSLCKSYFNPIESQNIRHEQDFMVIQGTFELNGAEEAVYCGLKRGQKKVFRRNRVEYDRLADHVGLLPVVVISPTDTNLITEGSEERRKFMDSIIAQFDRPYLDDLIAYNRIVSQRNALLKLFFKTRRFDPASLDIWDMQMIPLAERIFEKRKSFMDEFIPIFSQYYRYLSSEKEVVEIRYQSDLFEGDFAARLQAAQEKDRILQYSTAGIHKDDLVFTIGGHPVKRFASQGQQKSFLISLKLAQFDFIREIKQVKPILLLDDIFDKLDDHRVKKLMQLVSRHNFGQIFVTDTHPERIQAIFREISVPVKTFTIQTSAVMA